MKRILLLCLALPLSGPLAFAQEITGSWEGDAALPVWRGEFVGDWNADGHPEILITRWGWPGDDYEHVVRSGADDSVLWTAQGTGRFAEVRGLGDVDGDGHDDFVFQHPADSRGGGGAGAVDVLSGKDQKRIYDVVGAPGEALGEKFEPAGDLNGDTIPDFWLLFRHVGGGTGRGVRGFSGVDGTPLMEFAAPRGMWRFPELAGGGDLTGDATPDLLVGDHVHEGKKGYGGGGVWIFDGATGALAYEEYGDESGYTDYDEQLGLDVEVLGDLDGDGDDEYSLSYGDEHYYDRDETSIVRVQRGGSHDWLYTYSFGIGVDGDLGERVEALGDVNGDGVPDFAMSDYTYTEHGALHLYSGATGLLLHRMTLAGGFRLWRSPAADVDRDGLPELLVWDAGIQGRDWVGRIQQITLFPVQLNARPKPLGGASKLQLTTAEARPSTLAALFAVEINSSPFVLRLATGHLNDNGRWKVKGTIPPGLSGVEVVFLAFAKEHATGKYVRSNLEPVTFE